MMPSGERTSFTMRGSIMSPPLATVAATRPISKTFEETLSWPKLIWAVFPSTH
jgi:hypothetical protein